VCLEVVSTGSAVIRNGWSLAWKGWSKQSKITLVSLVAEDLQHKRTKCFKSKEVWANAKNSSPYFAQKIMKDRSLLNYRFWDHTT